MHRYIPSCVAVLLPAIQRNQALAGRGKRPEKANPPLEMKYKMLKNTLIRAAFVSILLFLCANVSFSQTTKSYIEKMSGWESCSACAGAGGAGPYVTHSMTRFISSPTMGGTSSKYYIGGTASYGDALWWKQLGEDSSAHNFQYSAYFYLKDPSAVQALEFDVNQSVDGHKFIFGTQCDVAGHSFDVYSKTYGWVQTGIACSSPSAYKWHHIILEFQRTSGGNVSFISVSIDGNKHYINRKYAPRSSSTSELNVAFQMDGRKSMTPYSTWLEDMSLKYW